MTFKVTDICRLSLMWEVPTSLLLYQFTKKVITLTNNYRGISLLSTSCKIWSNIIFNIDENIGNHEREFRRIRSTTDQIFCIRQMLENKMWVRWDSTFVDIKKAYVFYSILIEFGIPMNLVRLIKMCLNKTYSITYALWRLLLNLALEYAIRKAQENDVGLKFNGTHRLLALLIMWIYWEIIYSKSGHKNSIQIVWKCVTVKLFGNYSNKSKFDSGGN
jgi:hypothetical protein